MLWSLLEFYHIVGKDGVKPAKILGVVTSIVIFASSFLYAQNLVNVRIFLVIIPLLAAIFIACIYRKEAWSFRAAVYTVGGLVYIAVPFSMLNGLAYPSLPVYGTSGGYFPDVLLGFFILLWTNDTFAYLTGILLGKHRLFERISPKKSWEGFFGGLLFTAGMAMVVARMFPVPALHHWLVIAALSVVFGVYGDLLESLLKRNMGMKDSGHFLPGHGGILDRFDVVLLAAPMVYAYVTWFVF
jgi:phosphatidate cytidylyltransferase